MSKSQAKLARFDFAQQDTDAAFVHLSFTGEDGQINIKVEPSDAAKAAENMIRCVERCRLVEKQKHV